MREFQTMVMIMMMAVISMKNLSVQEERVKAMQAEEERQARWQAATIHNDDNGGGCDDLRAIV